MIPTRGGLDCSAAAAAAETKSKCDI